MTMDFLEITKKYGKPICTALYAGNAYLMAKKKYAPMAILVATHTAEYFIKGRKIAEENGIDQLTALANCLAFGFCWWLPLEKAQEE